VDPSTPPPGNLPIPGIHPSYTQYLPNDILLDLFLLHPSRWDATLTFKVVFGLTAAVMHAHAHGCFHGRIQPFNIMFDSNWDVHVVGFGHKWSVEEANLFDFFSFSRIPTASQSKFDVYPFGMILDQIITGPHQLPRKRPFKSRRLFWPASVR
jgi:hypothetical protein